MVGAAVLSGVLTAAAGGTATAATGGQSVLTAVHGLRGVVADVSLDGTEVLQGFQPERTTDPIPVTTGRHQVEVRQAGAENGEPLLSAAVDVPAAANLSLVVHLDEAGEPALTPFTNDVARLASGQSRLVLRHVAAGPAVRVLVDGKPLGGDLANGTEAATALAAGNHSVTVQSPDGQVIVPERPVDLSAGGATFLYLIGAAQDDSLGWLVQNVNGLGGAPSAVPTGTSGLADPGRLPAVALIGLVVLAAACAPSVRAARS